MKTLTEKETEEIRKDPNNLSWYSISACQKLSEPFIREFQNEVVWSWISRCQKLSEDFIYEFIDKIDIDYILKHQTHLSIETRNKIKVIYKLSK